MNELEQSDGLVLEKDNVEQKPKMTYEEIIKEISIAEKMITDFSSEVNKKISNLKKERDLVWKDWQTEEQVRLKKYIGKLCFVSDTGKTDDWKIALLEKVSKTKSKENPFHYFIEDSWHEYYFFKSATTDSIKKFIYKE